MPDVELNVDTNIDVDIIDHLHGDDAIPMQLVEHISGRVKDAAWVRYLYECPSSECDHQRIVLVIRQKTNIEATMNGEPMVEPGR